MFRALVRVVLLIVVLVAVGAFLLGWWGGRARDIDEPRDVVGTAGAAGDRAKAAGSDLAQQTKEAGADVAQKTAAAAGQARRSLAEGSLTAKIKSKMALDDTVKALNLDVDTTGTVVTISGTVATEAERARAMQLAKETEGVTQVVDRMQIRR
jgi:hyperosmotically inducible periplasmic protein